MLIKREPWTANDDDKRRDVYALGALLYRLIEGRVPGINVKAAPKPGDGSCDIPDTEFAPSRADVQLKRIINHCLDPVAERRYHDAGELLEALKTREWCHRRRPLAFWGIVLPLLIVVVAAFVGGYRMSQALDDAEASVSKPIHDQAKTTVGIAAARLEDELSLILKTMIRVTYGEIPESEQIIEVNNASLPALLEATESIDGSNPQAAKHHSSVVALEKWMAENGGIFGDLKVTNITVLNKHSVHVGSRRFDGRVMLSDNRGNQFEHRDYMHGRGYDYDPDDLPSNIKLITSPHRSGLFEGKSSGNLKFVLSTPVKNRNNETVGVLAAGLDVISLRRLLYDEKNLDPILQQSKPTTDAEQLAETMPRLVEIRRSSSDEYGFSGEVILDPRSQGMLDALRKDGEKRARIAWPAASLPKLQAEQESGIKGRVKEFTIDEESEATDTYFSESIRTTVTVPLYSTNDGTNYVSGETVTINHDFAVASKISEEKVKQQVSNISHWLFRIGGIAITAFIILAVCYWLLIIKLLREAPWYRKLT